tara:strand:- start:331 stop:1194 length:864 start_codon:yes stop_codon:yes gene_type:complete
MSKNLIIKEDESQKLSSETIYNAYNLDDFVKEFEKLIDIYNKANDYKIEIENNIEKLKKIYQELTEMNKRKDILFCLDSFFFQYKIYLTEFKNLENLRLIFGNRLYCDNYKLYNLMLNDIKENEILEEGNYVIQKYEIYKDLETSKEYDVETIKKIHKDIIQLITALYEKYTKNTNYVNNYNKENKVGFAISNYLNTVSYENQMLLGKISLYKNYIKFFDDFHIKNFNKLILDYENFKNDMLNDLKSDSFFYVQDNHTEINREPEIIEKNIEDKNLIQQESIEKNEE